MARREWRGARRDLESRWIAVLLQLYPRGYRTRHAVEVARAMHACFERERLSCASTIVTFFRMTVDAVAASIVVRRDARRTSHLPPRTSGDTLMQSLLYDLRHAFRTLRRAPLFSALVVTTLALAVGANTAIFSVVNGVLLRSLPYGEPDRLVVLYEVIGTNKPFGFSAPDLAAFQDRAHSFDGIGAFRSTEYELSGIDQPERISAARISASLLDVLGVRPALGRAFTIEEDTGRQPVAILGDGLWRR